MLGPVFSTRVRRTVYPIRIDGGLVEAGLDQGEIITGEQHAPICELELELKQGEPAILFEVARAFSVVVPVTLGVRTKPERGYAMLAQGTADPIEKAKDLILAPVMPAEQAFRITARACLRQLIANVPATCAGKDEGLHQMRIGIRRLRAAINAFAEIVEDNRSEDIKKTLKWMIKSLGPARDLDVLARQIETSRPAGEHAGLIDKLMRTLQEKRELAYARAAGAIRSTRFGTGLIELAEWIEYGAWANAEDEREWLDEAVALHAAEELARRRRKIRKRGEKLRKLGDRERHKLRIRAKALRYIVEFFASLFPGHKREKRREAALSALKDLQDALGELNDIAAHRGILREAAIAAADGHAEMTDLADLADNLAGPAQEKRVESLLKAAEKAHAKFAETKAFWK